MLKPLMEVNKQDLYNQLVAYFRGWKDLHLLKMAVIYGSFVNQQGSFNDVDIAIYPLPFKEKELKVLKLIQELESITSPHKVDLAVISHSTSSLLRFEITRKSRVLYEEQAGLFEQECSLSMRLFADEKKFRDLKERETKLKIDKL